MSLDTIDDVAPVARALESVQAAMAELITQVRAGGLDHHDESELLALLEQTTTVANQFQAFDADLIAACRDRGVAEKTCRRTMRKVLEQVCRIGGAEAGRRVRAADAAGPRTSPVGLPLPRMRERVADAMSAGVINPEQTATICRTLAKIDDAGVHPDQVATVEAELVDLAARFGPRELTMIGHRYLDIYDPDGTEPDEQRNWDRRFFRMRQSPSGAVFGEFRLTGATGAKLAAILEPLAKPRIDRTEKSRTATSDLRSREQRLHDAVDDACARLLRAGGLPASGGTPATVVVTIDVNDLLAHTGAGAAPSSNAPDSGAPDSDAPDSGTAVSGATYSDAPDSDITDCGAPDYGVPDVGAADFGAADPGAATHPGTAHSGVTASSGSVTGEADHPTTRPDPGPPGRIRRRRPRHGVTSHGVAMTVPELMKLADEAEIYPVVLTKHGVLLDMGRSRRIANKHQTIALIARDGGCSFPGCDFPPEWCERHHIVSWLEGGKTVLSNLTLLCAYHHHNFLNRGWDVRLNGDGLPEWRPPRWIDPDQTPILNNRIVARIHQTALLGTSADPPNPARPTARAE